MKTGPGSPRGRDSEVAGASPRVPAAHLSVILLGPPLGLAVSAELSQDPTQSREPQDAGGVPPSLVVPSPCSDPPHPVGVTQGAGPGMGYTVRRVAEARLLGCPVRPRPPPTLTARATPLRCTQVSEGRVTEAASSSFPPSGSRFPGSGSVPAERTRDHKPQTAAAATPSAQESQQNLVTGGKGRPRAGHAPGRQRGQGPRQHQAGLQVGERPEPGTPAPHPVRAGGALCP